jgi:hypothetical protein
MPYLKDNNTTTDLREIGLEFFNIFKHYQGDTIKTHTILVGKPERKRSRGGPRHVWEDNIKIEIK